MLYSAVENLPKRCDDRDQLQAAYQRAITLWTNVGGTDPERMHFPIAVTAKNVLDQAAKRLLDHRQHHDC
jgi:hypothetical protein